MKLQDVQEHLACVFLVDHKIQAQASQQFLNNNIIYYQGTRQDYVNNDDQFTRKTAIPQDNFLDLVHLVLTTTWYTLNSQF